MAEPVTIEEIFNQSQTGLQGHGKLMKSLHKIYDKLEYPVFWSQFSHYVKHPMIVFKREPAVERVIDFVAKFVPTLGKAAQDQTNGKVDEEEEEEEDSVGDNKLLQDMFEFLLESHSATDKAVRFRCCQLINKLLTNLGEDAQIDDSLYEQLYECMLERLKDKSPVVRYYAVLAMSRLQDPTDENCPVIKAYLFLLNCDPNSDVRRVVVSSIAPSTKTLASIVGRTRDVKDTVRKTTYEVLAEKIHIKALSIALRLQLLNDGLNDRAEAVRQACAKKMLQAWLRTFNGNILTLLKSLDVEDSTDICSKVLGILFKASTATDVVTGFNLLNENLLITQEELTSESALYWQCVCKYLHDLGTEGDEYMEKVLPTCVEFCAYIQRYVDDMKTIDDAEIQLGHEFIIEQLLLIASYMDTADLASRKALETVLHNMLLADHISNRLVKSVVHRTCDLRGRGEQMVAYFAETVSEIREPISEDVGKDENMGEAGDVADGDDVESSRNGNLKNDPLTLLKCQTIISEMVQELKLSSVNPTLQMLVESQIVPGIQNENAEVRNMAMQALGQCCCLNSKDLLITYIPLFMQASQIDVEMVRVTALKVLFDLLLIYGLEAVDISENSSTDSGLDEVGENVDTRDGGSVTTTEGSNSSGAAGTASKLVAIICSFLDGESSELRTYAAEGLAKLLLSGRVVSSKILSHLILLWYNPLSEDDTHLRDCLGTLFPLYALASRANQQVVEDAFLPTLRTLLNAPHSSPLTEVNVNNVAELLVQLTDSTLIKQQNNSAEVSQDNPGHDNLSEKVCNEILSNPESENVRLWARILNQMRVSPDNEVTLKDLRVLCYKMVKTVKERFSLRSLQKFQAYIDQLASKYVTSDDDLSNIEIEPVVHEQDVEDDTAETTPKRKRVRGLYSQNLTLGMESESELDITEDVSMDVVDASVLMSRTSEVPTRRLSRKNTMTEMTADNEVFVVPPVPDIEKAVTSSQVADRTDVMKNKVDRLNEELKSDDQSETNIAPVLDSSGRSPQSRASARKSTTKSTREGAGKSPPKSSKSPRDSPGKSPRSGLSAAKGKEGEKSPGKSAKSPKSSSTESPRSRQSTRKSTSKTTDEEKAKSKSVATHRSVSQDKRPRSGDEDESPKRRKTSSSPTKSVAKSAKGPASKSPIISPAERPRSSKSTEKRSKSQEKESVSAKKRRVSSSPSVSQKRKSTDTAQGAERKRPRSVDKASETVQSVGKKSSQSSTPGKQAASLKKKARESTGRNSSKSPQQKAGSKKDVAKSKAMAKSTDNTKPSTTSPRSAAPKKNERSPGVKSSTKVVPDTPELKSPRIFLRRMSGVSVAETPERKGSKSARSGATPSSDSSPEKSVRSDTKSRERGSRLGATSGSPQVRAGTRSKASVAVTPVSGSPRTSLSGHHASSDASQKSRSSKKESGKKAAGSAQKITKNRTVDKSIEDEDDDEVVLKRKVRPSHRSATASMLQSDNSSTSRLMSPSPRSTRSTPAVSSKSASSSKTLSSTTTPRTTASVRSTPTLTSPMSTRSTPSVRSTPSSASRSMRSTSKSSATRTSMPSQSSSSVSQRSKTSSSQRSTTSLKSIPSGAAAKPSKIQKPGFSSKPSSTVLAKSARLAASSTSSSRAKSTQVVKSGMKGKQEEKESRVTGLRTGQAKVQAKVVGKTDQKQSHSRPTSVRTAQTHGVRPLRSKPASKK